MNLPQRSGESGYSTAEHLSYRNEWNYASFAIKDKFLVRSNHQFCDTHRLLYIIFYVCGFLQDLFGLKDTH